MYQKISAIFIFIILFCVNTTEAGLRGATDTDKPFVPSIIITPDYKFYHSKDDFHKHGLNATFRDTPHMVHTNYTHTVNLDDDHVNLYSASLSYVYTTDQITVGGFLRSSSDHLFGSVDVTDASAILGFSLIPQYYSKNKPDLNYNFKAGVTVTNQNWTGSYILPYFDFSYNGEYVQFIAGFPYANITFTPSQDHTFFASASLARDFEVSYTYKFFDRASVKLKFSGELFEYKIQADAIGKKAKNQLYWVDYREWLGIALTYNFTSDFSLETKYAYQLNGYKYYGKLKDFEKSPSKRLPYTNMFGISFSVYF